MKPCLLARVSDHELLRSFEVLVQRDRAHTAELVAHIAEIDERRLWAPAGCASMYDYCVRVWHMSEEYALKRIRAARAARRFPAILDALADGRLHLSAVVAIAASLTVQNADDLIAAATHRTRDEVELLIAAKFPKSDVPTTLKPVAIPCPATTPAAAGPVACVSASAPSLSAPQVAPSGLSDSHVRMGQPSPGTVVPSLSQDQPALVGPVAEPRMPASGAPETATVAPPVAPYTRVRPLSPGRYALQVTIDQETHDLLQQAKALLAHQLPTGDMSEVLKRALDVLVAQLERTKFAETDAPRRRRSHADGRYIPAEIKRAVWKRDGGRCTFVGANGRRCGCRSRLEFDHIIPVSRGGKSTEDNLRLRCQAHNQYEAERMFGAGFMKGKREARSSSRATTAGEADAMTFGSP